MVFEVRVLYSREYANRRIFLLEYNDVNGMEAGYMNSSTLNALAESNRLHIVDLLRDGALGVGEIGTRLRLRQPQVSKHLKVLKEAQVVEVIPVANRRIYRLRPEPLLEMYSWLGTFQCMWEDQLDRLDDYLKEQEQKKEISIGRDRDEGRSKPRQ